MKNVSLIIPTYNSADKLEKCLQAIQDIPVSEVIVVDDGSTDNTRNMISKKYSSFTYIYQSNSGPATARNTGAKKASSDLLVFIDADTIPQKNFIEHLVNSLENNAVASFGTYETANKDSILAQCIQKEIRYRHDKIGVFAEAFGSYCLLIKRNVFEKLGGFNTKFRYASGEDTDLSYRITEAGFKIKFVNEAKVAHHHPENVLKYLKEQFRHGFWRARIYKHHPNMVGGDGYTQYKDIIEPQIIYMFIFIYVFQYFINREFYKNCLKILRILLLGFLIFIQFIYSLRLKIGMKNWIFWSTITFFRAFSRTIGFSLGLLRWAVKDD